MDTTIPPGVSRNPYKIQIEEFANYKLNYHPVEYQKFGTYASQAMP
jgi:hypothetical protein